MKEKQKVRCPRCKHDFYTQSKDLVSCNQCGKKFKRAENLVGVKND